MQVFSVGPDGSSEPVPKVYCKNEDQELQVLLDRRPDLLPGDQINPDDPRRWLVIAREMPVPDPNSGERRWSIDFLMSDQDATPTFVEVKRAKDTRSRREVVAQMLEYAANGHYYWQKEELREQAERTAVRTESTLEARLQALAPTDFEGTDSYFEKMVENLREGQVRLVFFLEESPMELRSLVDFLNRQMERSEVLLVEAQLFERNGQRFVVPALFGYSEEARRTKRTVKVETGAERQRRKWDRESFFEELADQTTPRIVEAAQKLHEFATSQPVPIKWGNGKQTGTMSVLIIPSVATANLVTLDTRGFLGLWFIDTRGEARFCDLSARLHQIARAKWGLDVADDHLNKNPRFAPDAWVEKVDLIVEGCWELVRDASEP